MLAVTSQPWCGRAIPTLGEEPLSEIPRPLYACSTWRCGSTLKDPPQPDWLKEILSPPTSFFTGHTCLHLKVLLSATLWTIAVRWSMGGLFGFLHSQKSHTASLKSDTISPPSKLKGSCLHLPASLKAKQLSLGCTINGIREVNPEF